MVSPLPILKDGGTLIIAAECSEGIGGAEYTELMLKTEDVEEFMERIWVPRLLYNRSMAAGGAG
jgi:nickel-dependent lactate racemase